MDQTELKSNLKLYSYMYTVQYSTVQYSTVQYRTVQYSTVQYSIVHSTLFNEDNDPLFFLVRSAVLPPILSAAFTVNPIRT